MSRKELHEQNINWLEEGNPCVMAKDEEHCPHKKSGH
jgi:hypothetical protein